MTLHLGIDFDGLVYAPVTTTRQGILYAGPRRLLQWLEAQLGLAGYPERTDYLRIELFRQAMQEYLAAPDKAATVFFEASFLADRFATAEHLLHWRDELVSAGWDFQAADGLPPRLRVFAALEPLFAKKTKVPEALGKATGAADRMAAVLAALDQAPLPLEQVFIYEPATYYNADIQFFIKKITAQNTPVTLVPPMAQAGEHCRLGQLQRRLLAPLQGLPAVPAAPATPGDHSLTILQSRRDSDAARALAAMLRLNPALKPMFLAPELNLTLEQALSLEGLPAMGVLSASPARPSLQVLKLAPAFLWEPLDVFKIMEFVTLPVKPLDDGLALEIARVMAEKPGMFSDTWFAAVYGYLEQAEIPDETRRQYEFWFERRRYRAEATAPKRDAIAIYEFLQQWAHRHFDETGRKNTSLLVMADQARQISELLEALPEQRVGYLELERIVRTIYDPSPVQMAGAETGAFAYVHQPGAIAEPADTVCWWNCLFENTTPPPDHWQQDERNWLTNKGIHLPSLVRTGQLNLLRQYRPVLQARQHLVLVVPEQSEGVNAVPHLLLGDIEALFGELKPFTFCLDQPADLQRLAQYWQQPEPAALDTRTIGRPRPHLVVRRPDWLPPSEYETPTNLELLLYYPHRWFFKQKTRLNTTRLLSVTGDQTLLGSLAHRFFEFLLKDELLPQLDKIGIFEWVDRKAEELLEKEGATLLLYGREPERNAFLKRVKNAAWSLVSLLRANQWQVLHTEHNLEGLFAGVPMRGKADLVLERGAERAIVDLKWSGARRRKELIQNEEDLQLVLYAHLLGHEGPWPHTAYFILEDGKMIARNKAAFTDAVPAGAPDQDHAETARRILERMERTFHWRMDQLRQGMIEIRTARTAQELDALYAETLLDLLEMKTDDARWDDYRTLLQFS